jgi:hypothetical protein
MGHRRTILVMMFLLVVFAAIFAIAFFSLQKKQSTFGIGIPVELEDWLIMILSLLSIAKIVWEIVKIERHK